MTDREKLVGLLESTESAFYWSSADKSFVEKIADHLITNGVTFSKGTNVHSWIPVSERLPENRDDVLVCRTWWHEKQKPQIGWYNEVAGEWHIITVDGDYPCHKITHWMPLPEPPKEVSNGQA